jgi:hypothetical protein
MADPAAGGGAAGRRGSGGTASAADGWPVAGGAGWGGIGGKQRKARMRRRKTDGVGGKWREVDEGRRGCTLALSCDGSAPFMPFDKDLIPGHLFQGGRPFHSLQ